jgi:hypothetical protein
MAGLDPAIQLLGKGSSADRWNPRNATVGAPLALIRLHEFKLNNAC